MAARVFFFGGVLFALMAPLSRRSHKTASAILGIGAFIVLSYAFFELTHSDVRIGQAAIGTNRRFELLALACELPVVIFAAASLRFRQKTCFWAGWIINLGYSLWLAVLFVWLKFFWHW